MQRLFLLPLTSDDIQSLDSIQDIVSVVASNKVEQISKTDNWESTSFFTDLVRSVPLVRC